MSESAKSPRTFVLVGHCGPDTFMLRTAIERSVPGAAIVHANEEQSVEQYLDAEHVLLVNRVLDGGFADSGGINLIRRLKSGTNGAVIALVSNLDDAQNEAVAAGASPGFGKSQLYEDTTEAALRDMAGMKQN